MGIGVVTFRVRRSVAGVVASLASALVLAGCGGAEPDREVELFESGTLERLELDGRVVAGGDGVDDDAAGFAVMCLWASSRSGPLVVTPEVADEDWAEIRDVQINFDRDSLRLTSVDLRIGEDWSRWSEGAGAEAPVFRTEGSDFSLDGQLTGAAGTRVLGVSGSCETPFG
ncbi:hypothetical protein G6016_03115 [Dietzia aerolata]|uniref:Lipoprotein n=1 Tax=Dietzia aerolata TaxID=595984 RepID=A0ABV5JSQ0_9ACTN|nr:hypothetical protein [Dietzia aerolata]MBB0967963.1 hypothetical protein [Dietzia aerolata]